MLPLLQAPSCAGAALALVLLCAPAARPQTVIPREFDLAQRLLHLTFPESFAQHIALALTADDGQLTVRVEQARNPLVPSRDAAKSPLVDIRVTFERDGTLARFEATGPLAREAHNRALGDMLAANPGWRDQEARSWLIASGASYGPDRLPDLERVLEPTGWRPFLGRDQWMSSVQFRWRDSAPSVAADAPGWVVGVTAIGADGQPADYTLRFEPYAGRVVTIVKR